MLFDIIWNPDPAIFSIGGFALRWYGACWAMAFALCYMVIVRIFRKENINTEYADSLLIYVFFSHTGADGIVSKGLGIYGAWVAMFIDQGMRMTLNLMRFHSRKWTRIKV